jgi:hypothetical protein
MITTREISSSEKRYTTKIGENKNESHSSSSDIPTDPKEVAEYCASILANVRDLAAGSGLTFLAYLVQVAVEEAKIQITSDH